MIRYSLFLTRFVGIGNLIIATETTELHLVVLPGLDTCLRLPHMVNQVVQGIVRELRAHVTVEKYGYDGLNRCAAIVHDVPPGDAHHVLAAEPEAIEVLSDHCLNLLAFHVGTR